MGTIDIVLENVRPSRIIALLSTTGILLLLGVFLAWKGGNTPIAFGIDVNQLGFGLIVIALANLLIPFEIIQDTIKA